jgi:exo-beta-1,3-glucanase (GH17 family)
MRALAWALAALCAAPVGVLAVPHGEFFNLGNPPRNRHSHPRAEGDHRHRHAARRLETDTVTNVVTVTANHAVVWVDQNNKPLSTDYHDVVLPTETPSSFADNDMSSAFATADPAAATSSAPPAETEISTASAPPATSVALSPPAATSTPDPATSDTLAATAETSAAAPAQDNASAAKIVQGGDADANTNTPAAGAGWGIDYELIQVGGCITQSQMNSEFRFLASQGYSHIRFYDIGCDLSVATAAAAAAGLSVTLGLNTINNVAGDINTLIGMIKGNWDPINTVVIGNEVVNQGGSAVAVVNAVNTARAALTAVGFTKNVVAVDTFNAHRDHPEICSASSYCAVNCHAFFNTETTASGAGQYVQQQIQPIQAAHPDKQVIVQESGWPHCGDANGVAIPSPANQQAAITSLKNAFAGNPGQLFLFQAYDAKYKAPGYLGVEQCFGIYGN